MGRSMFDCRDWPGQCTLVIAGTPDEVVAAQALHVVAAHGQHDDETLRTLIRNSLRPAPEGT